MKNSTKLIVLLLLTTIYGFAIGLVNKPADYPYFRDIQQHNQSNYFLYITTNLHGFILQSESLLNVFNNFPTSEDKNQFNEYSVITQAKISLLKTIIAQYIAHSNCFTLKYQNTDIVFPFHCFW